MCFKALNPPEKLKTKMNSKGCAPICGFSSYRSETTLHMQTGAYESQLLRALESSTFKIVVMGPAPSGEFCEEKSVNIPLTSSSIIPIGLCKEKKKKRRFMWASNSLEQTRTTANRFTDNTPYIWRLEDCRWILATNRQRQSQHTWRGGKTTTCLLGTKVSF